jgi:hypothetical protein
VAVGEETDRGGESNGGGDLSAGRRLLDQGRGDAARRASGAGPALACRTGEPVGQAQPGESEGGAGPGGLERAMGIVGLEANRRKKKGEENKEHIYYNRWIGLVHYGGIVGTGVPTPQGTTQKLTSTLR